MKEIISTEIGGAKVICFTKLDTRHIRTNNTEHHVSGQILQNIYGLAICKYEEEVGFYLFYCDPNWSTITDTWHETVDDAKEQAEFEFTNTLSTWENIFDSNSPL
jgi:hypothetical protein